MVKSSSSFEYSLLNEFPEIAKEWHPTKNGDLSPRDVSSGSHKKVWWLCDKGHEWEATVSNRAKNGSKCPVCGKKIMAESLRMSLLKKSGSLLDTNPDSAKEWHPTKNGTLTPKDISAGSKMKVWWLCDKGHEWEAIVYSRVKMGRGCPICGKEKQNESYQRSILNKSGSLLKNNPEIAKEWHPIKNGTLTPNDITSGSSKKVWWLGQCGHEWQSTPCSRTKQGSGCPICSKKVMAESIRKTLKRKSGSLQETNPEIAKEWHPTKNGNLTPNDVSAGSNVHVWWLCKCGNEWNTSVYTHAKQGRGCPNCAKTIQIETYKKTMLAKSGSLLQVNPELAKEWHPTKNGELTPDKVTPNNNDIKVWWQGKCGHEWEARIASRSAGSGCPICDGKIVLAGFNDLATKYPYIAKEWHPNKNGSLLASNVAPKSMKKVWWKCPKGHEWKASIASRTSNGTGCIYCAMERQTSFPEQAMFYYFSKVTTAVNRYIDNKKEIDVYLPEFRVGIEYDGIRYHSSERSIKKEQQKDEYFSNLGIRIIRVKESTENRVDNDKVFFKYTVNYTNLPWAIKAVFELIGEGDIIPAIDINQDRGNIYTQYIQSEKENSLAVRFPEIAKEWNTEKNIIDASMIPAASNKKVWWKCPEGHEWCAQVNSRIRGSGCPICAGKQALAGYNDLATINPDIAKEWHPTKNGSLLPTDVTACSGKRVWWLCSCGYEWQTTVSTRANGTGCPICGKERAAQSRRKTEISIKGSLYDNNPLLAKEWHPTKNGDLTPQDVTTGSNKRVWWLGKCGHEWNSSPHNRINGAGCPICAGKSPFIKLNNLATQNPELVKEWHPTMNGDLTPNDVSAGSQKKVWWQCSKGHEWLAAVCYRNNGGGCPICSGKKVLAGYNDLATLNPELVKEWHPIKNGTLTPSDVTSGSSKKVWWLCEKGHEWDAIICNRSKKKSGCPFCNRRK